ncbi:hypothetical protein OS12_01240 [Dickeya oryzae]
MSLTVSGTGIAEPLSKAFVHLWSKKSDLTEEEKTIFLIDGIYSGISTNSKKLAMAIGIKSYSRKIHN